MNSDNGAAARKASLDFRRETRARGDAEAWKTYNAPGDATRRLTATLRAERLAREASSHVGETMASPARKTASRRA
jgi:hypothetical protein